MDKKVINVKEEGEKDFHVRTIDQEKIFDKIPGVNHEDDTLKEEMYNWGDEDDLPDSDRIDDGIEDPDLT